jgi:hypothetical protein
MPTQVHSLGCADFTLGVDPTFNKLVNNWRMFLILNKLFDSANPYIVNSGVVFKQFEISSSSWVPSGGVYAYNIEHILDDFNPQVVAWKKDSKNAFLLYNIEVVSRKEIRVFSSQNINVVIAVFSKAGPDGRAIFDFSEYPILEELISILQVRFVSSSSSSSSQSFSSSSLSSSSSSISLSSSSSSSSSSSLSSSSSSSLSSSSLSSSSSSSSSSLSSSSKSSSSESFSCFIELDDDFTGIDGALPNVHRWDTSTDSPVIGGNMLVAELNNTVNLRLINSRFFLIGDFDIQVDYDLYLGADIGISSWLAALEVRYIEDDLNRLRVYIRGEDTYYIMQSWDEGLLTQINFATTDTNGKLRISRVGSDWQGYYWNGVWATIGGTQPIGTKKVEVRIYAQTFTNFPTVTGRFDNFVVNSADSYLCPESSSSSSSSISSSSSSLSYSSSSVSSSSRSSSSSSNSSSSSSSSRSSSSYSYTVSSSSSSSSSSLSSSSSSYSSSSSSLSSSSSSFSSSSSSSSSSSLSSSSSSYSSSSSSSSSSSYSSSSSSLSSSSSSSSSYSSSSSSLSSSSSSSST